jgi:hypothetical protein
MTNLARSAYSKADIEFRLTLARIESHYVNWNALEENTDRIDQLLKLAEVQVNYLKIMHYQYQAQENRKI